MRPCFQEWDHKPVQHWLFVKIVCHKPKSVHFCIVFAFLVIVFVCVVADVVVALLLVVLFLLVLVLLVLTLSSSCPCSSSCFCSSPPLISPPYCLPVPPLNFYHEVNAPVDWAYKKKTASSCYSNTRRRCLSPSRKRLPSSAPPGCHRDCPSVVSVLATCPASELDVVGSAAVDVLQS